MSKIFIDLDNTLNDLIFQWIKYCNNVFNKNYTIKDITDWNKIYDLYSSYSIINHFFYINIYKNKIVKPLKGSQNFLKFLKKNGFKITIISDTYEVNKIEKYNWVIDFFGEYIDDIILSNFDKTKYIENMNVDIFIDDNPKYVIQSNAKMNFLFNYKNLYKFTSHRGLVNKKNYKMVYDYDDVINFLRKNAIM